MTNTQTKSLDLSRTLETIAAINRAAMKMNASSKQEDIISVAIRTIPKCLGSKKCAIYLYSDEKNHMELAAHNSYEIDPELEETLLLEEESVFSKIVQTGQSALITDIEAQFGVSGHTGYPMQPSIVTLVRFGEKLLGLISINEKKGGAPFDDWDFAIAKNFSEHLAAALTNAGVLHEEPVNNSQPQNQYYSKEMEILASVNEVAKKINATLDLTTIIDNTIAELPKLLKAGKCSIFLYKPEEEVLEMAMHNHRDLKRQMKVEIPINDQGLIGQVVRTGKSLLIKDIEKEFGMKNRTKYKSKSSMITILKSGEKLLGIININDKLDGTEFDEWDFSIAQNINEHMATAISNAQLFQQTRRLSITDGLTELYTHRYFQETLERETSRAKRYRLPLSLMMVDIDYFKKVNDTYGHQAGDAVLQSLSATVRQMLRRSDYACRYGGEEFAVILTETSLEKATLTAERLRETAEAMRIVFGEQELRITVSIGVSTLSGDMNKAEIIEAADQSLYRAKRDGRNQVCVAK